VLIEPGIVMGVEKEEKEVAISTRRRQEGEG
jgi:hypothetical protein